MPSDTRLKIFAQMDRFRTILNPYDKGWECLEVGIDGDELPSGNYKFFGKGNHWQTLDFLERLKPDIVADITNSGLPSNQWDLVICSQVLEHIFEVNKAIDELLRITKPGGYIILDSPFGVECHGNYDYNDYWRFSYVCIKKLMENRAEVIDGKQFDDLSIALVRKLA